MRLGMKTVAVGVTSAALIAISLPSVAHDGKLTFAPVLAEAIPAVVSIQVEQGARIGPWPNRGSAGSGVIIDARKGHVVTNHHVIDRAEKITVTLNDRRSFEAELIGSDPDTDIGLLKIAADNLQALPLGDSDELAVGDLVVAIGNPFGLSQTATSGIVSALGRSGFIRGGYEDFIQTDASINPGNSGGALVDLEGRLVGVNTVIVSQRSGGSAGLGFAVPTNIVRAVTDQLVEHGTVHRGRLGVLIGDVTPDAIEKYGLESDKGAVVDRVLPDSAAEAAGIEPEDVIVRLDDEDVVNMQDLRNRIALASAGQDVELVVIRGGKRRIIEATIGRVIQVDTPRSVPAPTVAGAKFRDLSRQHRLFGRVDGAEVVEVDRGSRAWELGLRSGDVITAVNGRRVGSVGEFERAVAEGTPYTIQLQRGNWQMSGVVR